jgi:hypothetical protein
MQNTSEPLETDSTLGASLDEKSPSENARPSDLVFIACFRGIVPYLHYGIYIGDQTVVHLATDESGSQMSVQQVTIEEFANGNAVCVEFVASPLPDHVVVERALGAVGQRGYDLVGGNCEHFARCIKTGSPHSHQVDVVLKSVVRSAISGLGATIGSRLVASSIALGSKTRMLLTAGAVVPALLAESTRFASYMAVRRCNVTHETAESTSRTLGYAAAAAGGFLVGGPAGSVSSLAISVAADRLTDQIHKRWNP